MTTHRVDNLITAARDVFISHARDDKEAVARPLAEALRGRGRSVWFDEYELLPGDSLRLKIDDGLSRSRIGVVILSPKFFARQWPQRELAALTSRQMAGDAYAIVPVWHGVDKADVQSFSPALADLVAIQSDGGASAIAADIDRVLARVIAAYRDDLPEQLLEALENSLPFVRESVVGELARLWRSPNPAVGAAAEEKLQLLLDDDSRRVAAAARTVLDVALLDPPSAQTDADAPDESPQDPGVSRVDEPSLVALRTAVRASTELVQAYRTHGHLAALLDPLGSEPEGDPGLDPDTRGLTPEIVGQIPARELSISVPGNTLADALPHLRETYCGTIAYEIEHIASHRQRVWLREHIESGAFRQPLTTEEQKILLKRLVDVDALERFLVHAYTGEKQFSIEGCDVLVPMLDELIQLSGELGAKEVLIGMAHRGRLNVLAHNLGRPYDTIFAEFEGASTLEAVTTIPQGGTGDVKYHHGTQGSYELASGLTIQINLESNSSHVEHVWPVVEGATRAAQTTRQGPHAHQDTDAAVPIVIHGDAAFPGQGVVSETFNLRALDGYTVGGTVHIITNNQVGFTTDPDKARSTRWASDLAKGFDVPIVHVNADDVPACMSAVRLAFAFREEFGNDVLIDLVGYRRHGHNESDEPTYTQPQMYAKIKSKKRVSELWADRLVAEAVISKEEVDRQAQEVWDNLTILHQRLKSRIAAASEPGWAHGSGEYQLDRSPSPEVSTAVPAERLRELGEELLRVPDGFTVHPKLVKQLERRREALGDTGPPLPGIDWAHAEALAFASLLTEGTPIRLTGQDSERGTFSQRHLVLHDTKTGQTVCPVQRLPGAIAALELHNSPVSELACLGFEYGYSQEAPETFVLWEAQLGARVSNRGGAVRRV